MISVIVPAFNQHEMTAACVEAVKECTTDYELILIDNGSDPPIEGATIRNEKNLGFPVAVNMGVNASSGNIVVLLNNDCIVTPGWDDKLAKHLKEFDIVGPMTNFCIGIQRTTAPVYEDKDSLYKMSHDWAMEHQGQVQEVNWVIGFCVMFTRKVLDDVGLFDTTLWPCTGEEIDYCLRARKAGYRIGVARDCFVHHYGSATFNEMDDLETIDYAEIVDRNNAYLEKKWGVWDRKQLVGPQVAQDTGRLKLNLGCGFKKIDGYVNIDMREEVSPDFLGDVRDGLPYENDSVDEVRAYDFLEHIPIMETVGVVTEIWRVLKPGGLFVSSTPDCERGQGAWMDPTHQSFWCEASWLYYSDEGYRGIYGIEANFEIKKIERVMTSPQLRIEHLLVTAVARK